MRNLLIEMLSYLFALLILYVLYGVISADIYLSQLKDTPIWIRLFIVFVWSMLGKEIYKKHHAKLSKQ